MAFFILTRFVLVKYSRAFVERPSQGTSSLALRLTTVSLDHFKTANSLVIKQPTQNALGRLLFLSTLHVAAFAMTALIHFEFIALSCGNLTLHTIHTLPSRTTVYWHAWYVQVQAINVHEGAHERRIKLQSLLLFYNILHNNTRVCTLAVTFYDNIS